MWKFSDFTGGIHTDLRILPVDFTSGIQGEAFVDLRWCAVSVVCGAIATTILSTSTSTQGTNHFHDDRAVYCSFQKQTSYTFFSKI